jgi:hypothetical protein
VRRPPRVRRIDVFDTRPGGRCLPADRRVGAPELPAIATEEIGMVQVHTWVSVHCDQCGDSPGGPGFEAHYPTEDAALDGAAAAGWLIGPGGRLWCSACGPVLTCEVEGHQLSAWSQALSPGGRPGGSGVPVLPAVLSSRVPPDPVADRQRHQRRQIRLSAVRAAGGCAHHRGRGGVMPEPLKPLDSEPVSVYPPFITHPRGHYRHEYAPGAPRGAGSRPRRRGTWCL